MSLKGKLEKAVAVVLSQSDELPTELRETANNRARVYLGADSDEQVRPCVVCWAQSGDEEPLNSGNYTMRVTVMVKSQVDTDAKGDDSDLTPVATHNARVAAVFGILRVEGLAILLSNAVPDLHVYEPVTEADLDPSLEGRSFVDAMSFNAYCCGSQID